MPQSPNERAMHAKRGMAPMRQRRSIAAGRVATPKEAPRPLAKCPPQHRTKDGYLLWKKPVQLRGGRMATAYFFSKKTPAGAAPATVPGGMEVARPHGMPLLRRRQ